jgi:hypothetical protein
MRLDHVSYVASHDQISDVVNRIGSQIGTAFVDGGIHPKFGTRNFTAPLLNGQYIEIVCPLDHPATDATPFGRAVKKKAEEGGGWMTWVFNTKDITVVEKKFNRTSVIGYRTKPNGTELKWKQIGVSEILTMNELPFFVEWQGSNHPSTDGVATATIDTIYISTNNDLNSSLFKKEIQEGVGDIKIDVTDSSTNKNFTGILSLDFTTNKGLVNIE